MLGQVKNTKVWHYLVVVSFLAVAQSRSTTAEKNQQPERYIAIIGGKQKQKHDELIFGTVDWGV